MSRDKKHILLAEDNLALSRVVEVVLKAGGYRVTTAVNGEIAWDLLNSGEQQFDMIVTDQQMPRLFGVELCERVRKHDQLRSIPIFLLTAKRFELDISKLESELGIARIFQKPFSPTALLEAVNECLSESSGAANATTAATSTAVSEDPVTNGK